MRKVRQSVGMAVGAFTRRVAASFSAAVTTVAQPRPTVVAAVAALAGVPACAASASDADGASGDAPVRVGAAASLSDLFAELGDEFTSATGVPVELTFAGSSELAAQLQQGAPIDVFAAADPQTMDRVVSSGDATDPVTFARNSMALVVEAGNPLGIDTIEALGDDDLTVVVCAPVVPCGAYAETVAAAAGIELRADSLERNVRSVLSKVALGEADVGMVYVTDITTSGGAALVDGITLPPEIDVEATYPIAVTTSATSNAAAQEFVDFVIGPEGAQLIAQFGFGLP